MIAQEFQAATRPLFECLKWGPSGLHVRSAIRRASWHKRREAVAIQRVVLVGGVKTYQLEIIGAESAELAGRDWLFLNPPMIRWRLERLSKAKAPRVRLQWRDKAPALLTAEMQ